MIKAPFMALVIGIVACSRGPAVKGSAESLGKPRHGVGGEVDLRRHRARRPCSPCSLLRSECNRGRPLSISPPFACRDLVVGFGSRIVLDRLSLDVRRGEILGFVGASGGGKSVLMRTIIGLIPRRSGEIEVIGTRR
jgi:ABC-type multidrug transport system fused ATPase/permease subunit